MISSSSQIAGNPSQIASNPSQIADVELLFFDFHSSGTPKVVNVSPKGFHPPLVGVLADLPLLRDGNEKPTVATVGSQPFGERFSPTVATVGLSIVLYAVSP
ncbi:MAG: hypothetical protein LBC20_17405 [Planctomycetaceae bacterium]|jgi:hypothetical protein|nr:hypothetical protein [Planctomycetaceae bacterium]